MESKTKFIRTYKSDISTSIWYYDLNKFKNGPVKVEIEYAPGVIESVWVRIPYRLLKQLRDRACLQFRCGVLVSNCFNLRL